MYKFMSGIKPTGKIHLGNYVNVIKPIISKEPENTIVLVADGHALTSETENIGENKNDLIKTLYSFDIKNVVFQSQIPEIMELMWILSCYTEKGHMNRAHGYKSMVEKNFNEVKSPDHGINIGFYTYPVLMTADLCAFGTEYVFIGSDQIQHVEIAEDIVKKFNYHTNTCLLNIPKPYIHSEIPLEGYDGRKMSKSYGNIIPLMCDEKTLRKHIFSVKTNFKNTGEPKGWDESPITNIYSAIAPELEVKELEKMMKEGIGWGEIKQIVFDKVNSEISSAREKYNQINSRFIKDYIMDKNLRYNRNLVKNLVHSVKNVVYS